MVGKSNYKEKKARRERKKTRRKERKKKQRTLGNNGVSVCV